MSIIRHTKKALKKFNTKKRKIFNYLYPHDYYDLQEKAINEIKKLEDEDKQAKEIYKKYKQITELAQNQNIPPEILEKYPDLKLINENNKYYFRWSYISWLCDDLNLNPHMFIISSAKNQGKTYQISQIIENTINNDPINNAFVYLRNHRDEVPTVRIQFAENDAFPCYLGDRGTFFHKRIKSKKKFIPCGFIAYISGSGLETKQGPSYRKIKAIIWDECNSTGGPFDFTIQDVRRFIIFCSSIIRDKKGVKTYLFFNKLRNVSGSRESIILKAFGISQDAKAKYMEFINPNNKDNINKLLYLDITEQHKKAGIDYQEGLILFTDELANDLSTNNPTNKNIKVVGLSSWINSKPLRALVISFDKFDYCLYIGELIQLDYSRDYIIYVDEYDPNKHYGYNPLTHSVTLFNKYNALNKNNNKTKLKHITIEVLDLIQQEIYRISQTTRLYYADDNTADIFNNVLESWENKYKNKWESEQF